MPKFRVNVEHRTVSNGAQTFDTTTTVEADGPVEAIRETISAVLIDTDTLLSVSCYAVEEEKVT